jgi:hypothetical protein
MSYLPSCDIYWELKYGSPDMREKLKTLEFINESLKQLEKQLEGKSARQSKYYPIAAAAGASMVRAGLEVTHYYNNDYDPPKKSKVVELIEICIEAAGLPPSKNLKKLVQIAHDAAKLASNNPPEYPPNFDLY